jgi:hypothetical protein
MDMTQDIDKSILDSKLFWQGVILMGVTRSGPLETGTTTDMLVESRRSATHKSRPQSVASLEPRKLHRRGLKGVFLEMHMEDLGLKILEWHIRGDCGNSEGEICDAALVDSSSGHTVILDVVISAPKFDKEEHWEAECLPGRRRCTINGPSIKPISFPSRSLRIWRKLKKNGIGKRFLCKNLLHCRYGSTKCRWLFFNRRNWKYQNW